MNKLDVNSWYPVISDKLVRRYINREFMKRMNKNLKRRGRI